MKSARLAAALALPLALLALASPGALAASGSGIGARALDAVRADDLRADLAFLASSELAGRDTPSPGQRIAARYLRSRLERLGWQPAAPGGFFYRYWLEMQAVDPAGCALELAAGGAEETLTYGADYFFHSSHAADQAWEGGVVFCGAGDEADFAGLDVSGQWALCWAGELSWRKRQAYAKRAGALGLLVAPGPDYTGEPFEERYGAWTRAPVEPRWPGGSGREVFPQVYLAPGAAERLLALAASPAPALGQRLEISVRDTRALAGNGGEIELEDVAALWPGSDPALAGEVLVLSAHYDHKGVSAEGEVFPGADDNGSGTAGLLAVAQALAEHGPLRRSVLLLWVSGEEKGLLGSRAWTTYPWLPEGYRPVCNINIDMIGRNAADELLITPTREHAAYSGLTQLAEQLAPTEGFPVLGSADEYYHRSDHAMFEENLGLPVCFLFSDVHEDYHMPTDTVDKLDYDKIRRVARLAVKMVGALQEDQLGVEPEASEAVWRTARARADVHFLHKAAEGYARANASRAPEALAVLVATDANGARYLSGWSELPSDPWGRDYELVRPSEWIDGFAVRSFGKDGAPGGEGEDQDVSSAEL